MSSALACDVVPAAENARFVMLSTRATVLALTGQPLEVVQAAERGLFWTAVPDAGLMAAAGALALKPSQGPTAGLGLAKRAMWQAAGDAPDAHLDPAAELRCIAGARPDHAEGVRRFLTRRASVVTGPAS